MTQLGGAPNGAPRARRAVDGLDSLFGRPARRTSGAVQARARLSEVEPGQQTGSKRLKSASLNHAEADGRRAGNPHE
jgi:hypothetical protein